MKLAVAAAAATLALSATAQAQPGNAEPMPAPMPVPQPQYDTVSESTAIGLSLGGTVISWAMLIAAGSSDDESMETIGTIGAFGTLLAPSFGHWYSHKAFTRGLGMRLAGATAATVAFAMAIDDIFEEEDDGDDATIGALLLVGAGLYVAGTIDDIATAGAAARKYNARFDGVMLMPTINAHGGGFSLTGRF